MRTLDDFMDSLPAWRRAAIEAGAVKLRVQHSKRGEVAMLDRMPDLYWEDSLERCSLRCGAQGIEVAYMTPSKGRKTWEGIMELPGNTSIGGRWKPKEDMRRQLAGLACAWFTAAFQPSYESSETRG